MGKKSESYYSEIEPDLSKINREIIKWDREENANKKTTVEMIVKKILPYMKRESPTVFKLLNPSTFGSGSSYEGLKIEIDGDFDIDILLRIPQVTKPVLKVDTIPGFVQLQLENLEKLQNKQPDLYRVLKKCVDDDNYLSTEKLKSNLMQSIFQKAQNNYFENGIITVRGEDFKISSVKPVSRGPAFTLIIQGVEFELKIDLVPCIILPQNYWPQGAFRSNPYGKPSEFFIVPKEPKVVHPHKERYFRLLFQKQEQKIIYDRFWMKPTIRIIKLLKKRLEHDVSSYAIKTLFMWKLFKENENLDKNTPEFWKGPFSQCLIEMLNEYLNGLENGIWFFWYKNKKLNLLDLSTEQINQYKKQIKKILDDLKENPVRGTILKYLN